MNAVFCGFCRTIIGSYYRHDFVSCECQEESQRVCVDGGLDYDRRVHGPNAVFTEIGAVQWPETTLVGWIREARRE